MKSHADALKFKMTRVVLYAATIAGVLSMGLIGSTSLAQQARVTKVSGRKAIVQFPKEMTPTVGQIIELGGSGDSSGNSSSGGGDSRGTIIGGSASLSSLSSNVGGGSGATSSTTKVSAEARYGWNTGVLEYGLIALFGMDSSSGASTTQFGGGGFADYNLVENSPGAEMVYGVGGQGTYSMVSGGGASSSVMNFFGGGQFKWFPLGNSVAIRGDGGYQYGSTSTNGTSISNSGFVLKAGFSVYF